MQSLLTDSLINSHGTPHIDVNSKEIMITARDSSAIVRDMHRRMISIARSPQRSDHAKESTISGASVFVTSMCTTAALPVVQHNDFPAVDPSHYHQQQQQSPPSPLPDVRKRGLEPSLSAPQLLSNISDGDSFHSITKLRPHTALAALQTHTWEPSFHNAENELNPQSLTEEKPSEIHLLYENEDRYNKQQTKLQHLQASQRLWSERLKQTADRDYGLPSDIFDWEDNACLATGKVGPDTGIRFLRAMASDPSIYEDVRGSRRRHQKVRPRTASSIGNSNLGEQSLRGGFL